MRKGDETFEDAARARVGGQIDDNEFLRRTAATWRAVTARLWRRWRRKLPADIGQDDLHQELLLQALEHVAKCSPGRGSSYGGYIVWCSSRRAQRQIHRWRNAKLSGEESRNPGRFERNFSSLTRKDDERREDYESRLEGESPDPIELIESERIFTEHLSACDSVREALVMIALRRAQGSIDGAAEEIWRSYPARVECGVTDVKHARRFVRRVVDTLTPEATVPELLAGDVWPEDDLFELDEVEAQSFAAA